MSGQQVLEAHGRRLGNKLMDGLEQMLNSRDIDIVAVIEHRLLLAQQQRMKAVQQDMDVLLRGLATPGTTDMERFVVVSYIRGCRDILIGCLSAASGDVQGATVQVDALIEKLAKEAAGGSQANDPLPLSASAGNGRVEVLPQPRGKKSQKREA